MFRRILKAFSMAVIAIVVGVAVAYAVDYTGTSFTGGWFSGTSFKATGTATDDNSNTQVMKNRIHMTSANDSVLLGQGDDYILMGPDNDTLDFGNGNDSIWFTAANNDWARIWFNNWWNGTSMEPATSYIQWTKATDEIEVRSGSGDVVITLGQ